MAEVDLIVSQASDSTGGVFILTAVVEDTQFTTDPRGRFSPTVVAVKISNTSNQRGQALWQSSNGSWNDNVVLSGEDMETRISPPNREFFHQWAGRGVNARWG